MKRILRDHRDIMCSIRDIMNHNIFKFVFCWPATILKWRYQNLHTLTLLLLKHFPSHSAFFSKIPSSQGQERERERESCCLVQLLTNYSHFLVKLKPVVPTWQTNLEYIGYTFRIELSMPSSSGKWFTFIILVNLFFFFPTSLIRQEHVSKCSHLMELLASSQTNSLHIKHTITHRSLRGS